jgi:hypothetical protein
MSTKIPLSCPPDKGKMRSIMRIIIEEPILSLPIPFHEKGILSLAKSFTENGSRLYLSDEDLSFFLFVSRITVNRSVQKLVRLGFIEKRVESREGGKSYRSLKYLGVEHSIKLLQCSNESDESIVSNLYSHSIKTIQCSPSIVSNLYNQSINLIHITKRNLKDHNLKVTESIVADAPLPTETELKNPLIDLDSVKEPLETLAEPETFGVTHPPQVSPPPLPKKKKAQIKEHQSLCPAPSVWLTPERMEKLKANAREVPEWAELSDPNLETAIKNLSYEMHTWSEGKGIKRPGWELTFKKWLPNNAPRFFEDKQSTEATKRDKARSLFDRLVTAASDGPQFHGAFRKLPTLAMLYDSDEAITNYREQLKPLKKGTKDYEMTEAVFVKRFLDKALQCQK